MNLADFERLLQAELARARQRCLASTLYVLEPEPVEGLDYDVVYEFFNERVHNLVAGIAGSTGMKLVKIDIVALASGPDTWKIESSGTLCRRSECYQVAEELLEAARLEAMASKPVIVFTPHIHVWRLDKRLWELLNRYLAALRSTGCCLYTATKPATIAIDLPGSFRLLRLHPF